MPKIVWGIYLLLIGPVFAHAMVCKLQSVKADMEPVTKSSKAKPYSPQCRVNGVVLPASATGESTIHVDLVNGRTPIDCDFSMNAFIEVRLPLVTVAITSKNGKILDVKTDWPKNGLHAIYWPEIENSFESLGLNCKN